MSPLGNIQFSLRTRMALLTGSIITVMMIVVSFSVLLQWRSLIVRNQTQNARNITRAFSTSVLDAFIYAESDSFCLEEQLEKQITDIIQKIPGIKYIVVLNRERRVMGHSDLSRYNEVYDDSLSITVCQTDSLISSIYRNVEFGWVLETVQPLQIAGKRWGVLRIGIDAKPLRREIKDLFFLLSILTLLVIIVTLTMLYFLIGRLTESLQELVSVMDEIEIDSDEIHYQPVRNDEVGFLVQHFKALEKRLSVSHEQFLNAQKQIYHAEKLASIGRLASGVAHEINNPLNGIKSCVYAINQDPNDKKQNAEYLELINEGLNNIETIVQKLLGFAHQHSKIVAAVNINECIVRVLQLLDYRLEQKQVIVVKNLNEGLPTIQADSQLFEEVIMNLLLNSMDAVTEQGNIEISSGRRDDKHIFVTISDDGEGIAEEDLQRIFDPFYTTKDPGKGTGLGLSVSLKIVESYGGLINVERKPERGVNFTIELPVEEQA